MNPSTSSPRQTWCSRRLRCRLARNRAGATGRAVLRAQNHHHLDRLHRRRQLRPLRPHGRAPPRQAHSRPADRRRAEHAGRRQPEGRELPLRDRAQGRHRARRHRRIGGARAGAGQSRRAIRRGEVHLCRPRRDLEQHLHAVAHRKGAIDRRRQAHGDLARRHRPGLDRRDRAAAAQRARRHQVQAHQRLSGLERGDAGDGARRGRRRLVVLGGGERRQRRTGCARRRSGSSCRPRRNASPNCRTRRASARSANARGQAGDSRSMRAAARSAAPFSGRPAFRPTA